MFDLAVIGLGPAGMEAVKCALNNNLSVVAFNVGKIGGTCLNVGCIPTKAILTSAYTYNLFNESDKLGINLDSVPNFNWSKIIERKESIVSKFQKSASQFLSNAKNLELVNAEAEIVIDGNKVSIEADYSTYEARNIIIATGSVPKNIKNLEFDGEFILSSDDMFNLKELPNSIAIIGSGAIGCEWAYILSSFNVKVYLIEMADNILPSLDTDIQKMTERILKSNGVQIFKNDYILMHDGDTLVLNSGKTISVDKILSCTGRKALLPQMTVLGYDGTFNLKINSDGTTDIDSIYVAGDATSSVMLAHNASYQAKKIINTILSNPNKDFPIPSVIYIHPEAASVGIREQDTDDSYEIKKISLAASSKAWCDNSTSGTIKIIIKDNLIKGAHIVSNDASSLINLFSLAIANNIPFEDIKNLIYPHPTVSELISEVLSR